MIGEQVHVSLKRDDDQERWHVVFRKPVNWRPEIFGAYAGTSANGEPVAGVILFRRDECKPEEAREKLKNSGPIFAVTQH